MEKLAVLKTLFESLCVSDWFFPFLWEIDYQTTGFFLWVEKRACRASMQGALGERLPIIPVQISKMSTNQIIGGIASIIESYPENTDSMPVDT